MVDAFSNTLLDEVLVVLSWLDKDSSDDHETIFLGQSKSTTLLLRYDAVHNTATFRLRVPFNLNSCKKGSGFLYVFINPTQIRSMQKRLLASAVPESVIKTLLRNQSSHGIIDLEINLRSPPTIVGPANTTRLSPRGDAAGNLLASLRSLTHATQIDLFIPQSKKMKDNLHTLCGNVSNGRIGPRDADYALNRLYAGLGAKDIRDLLVSFEFRRASGPSSDEQALESRKLDNGCVPSIELGHGRAESDGQAPPAYDQIQQASSPFLASPDKVRPGKRRASKDVTPPSSKKPLLDAKPQLSLSPPPELLQMRCELNALRWQLDYRTAAAASPTEDGTITDRLDNFEQRLCALEALLERLNEAPPTQPTIESVKAYLDEQIEQRVADLVERQMEDYMEEIKDDFSGLRDDIDVSVKDRIKDAVAEDLEGVVAYQLPDVVQEVFDASHLSVTLSRAV